MPIYPEVQPFRRGPRDEDDRQHCVSPVQDRCCSGRAQTIKKANFTSKDLCNRLAKAKIPVEILQTFVIFFLMSQFRNTNMYLF